ncbi:GumC family protein [Methylobacterium sp. Leaf108]|uniref:GumC family protein n=1 Tax=Methylobacterium sp. Leaf108 TaxID=1736256 RepID=UPI000AF654A4|nr:GumC family protein [Methylobacterium sp. Leaf108]
MYKYSEPSRDMPPARGPARPRGAAVPAVAPYTVTLPPLTPMVLAFMVWRHRIQVAVFGLVFALLGLAFGVLAPAKYAAFTQLIIDPTDLRVTDRSLRTASQYSDALIAQVENEIRVITSSSVLDRVVRAERLDRDDEFVPKGSPGLLSGIATSVRGLFGAAEPQRQPAPALTALRALDKVVSAKRDERTYVVTIGATSRDPDKAVRLADAVVDAYVTETAQTRDEVSRKIAGSLNDRIAELKSAVEQAEQRIERYKRANNIVSAVGSSVTEQQLVAASTRYQAAANAVTQAQSRYQQVMQARGSGDVGAIPDALQSATVMNLRSQVTEVQRRLSDLSATRGRRHPEVIEMTAQEATVRRALNEELGRIAVAAKTDLDRARADERENQRTYETLKAAVSTKDDASVRLRELERDLQASRSVYETFLNRTKEVSEQTKIDEANIRVISRAQVPERRSYPPRTLLLVIVGLVAGLALGVGIAIARGLIRKSGITLRPNRMPGALSIRRS